MLGEVCFEDVLEGFRDMCVYVCVCMYVCTYVCLCLWYVCVCVWLCVCVPLYVYMSVCVFDPHRRLSMPRVYVCPAPGHRLLSYPSVRAEYPHSDPLVGLLLDQRRRITSPCIYRTTYRPDDDDDEQRGTRHITESIIH